MYFFHRYQAEAAVKAIGGLEYTYALKGDGQTKVKPVDPKLELEALNAILETLSVDQLKIPERLLDLFPPRADEYNRTRESFASKNGVAFDALSAAATAADFVASLLFHPERASRMIQQKALFNKQLGFDQLLETVINSTFKKTHNNAYDTEIQQSINAVVLQNLLHLAADDRTSFQAKSIAISKINNLKSWLQNNNGKGVLAMYFDGFIFEIDSFFNQPDKFKKVPAPKIPDGSPIGSLRCEF